MAGWLNKFLGKPESAEEPDVLEGRAPRVHTREVSRAVEAHLLWQKRLRDVIHGESQEVLDTEAVSADWSCALGKWIYNPGQANYGHLPTFERLRSQHAAFHELAGLIVQNAQQGRRTEAQRQLLVLFSQQFEDLEQAAQHLEQQIHAQDAAGEA